MPDATRAAARSGEIISRDTRAPRAARGYREPGGPAEQYPGPLLLLPCANKMHKSSGPRGPGLTMRRARCSFSRGAGLPPVAAGAAFHTYVRAGDSVRVVVSRARGRLAFVMAAGNRLSAGSGNLDGCVFGGSGGFFVIFLQRNCIAVLLLIF